MRPFEDYEHPQLDRDRFLYEIMRDCLHEEDREYKNPWNEFPKCKICGKQVSGIGRQVNFSTWEGFGKLWEWSTQQDWWYKVKWHVPFAELLDHIDPDKFANRLYAYLKDKKK